MPEPAARGRLGCIQTVNVSWCFRHALFLIEFGSHLSNQLLGVPSASNAARSASVSTLIPSSNSASSSSLNGGGAWCRQSRRDRRIQGVGFRSYLFCRRFGFFFLDTTVSFVSVVLKVLSQPFSDSVTPNTDRGYCQFLDFSQTFRYCIQCLRDSIRGLRQSFALIYRIFDFDEFVFDEIIVREIIVQEVMTFMKSSSKKSSSKSSSSMHSSYSANAFVSVSSACPAVDCFWNSTSCLLTSIHNSSFEGQVYHLK